MRSSGIAVVLVMLCMILGPACAGPQGEQGVQGEQGQQGVQGEIGPTMVVSMGTVWPWGELGEGYNVTGCVWDNVSRVYCIGLPGNLKYSPLRYVTLVTPIHDPDATEAWNAGDQIITANVKYDDDSLLVEFVGESGRRGRTAFSFIVFETPDHAKDRLE